MMTNFTGLGEEAFCWMKEGKTFERMFWRMGIVDIEMVWTWSSPELVDESWLFESAICLSLPVGSFAEVVR